MKSVLSKVKDTKLFLQEIQEIRGIVDPLVVLHEDTGNGKTILTAMMMEAGEYNEDELREDFKATGQRRILVLAKAECAENRTITEIIFDEVDLASLSEDFQLVCDMSLTCKILGIQSCSSLYGCPYCEGTKIDEITKKPTNGRGRVQDP